MSRRPLSDTITDLVAGVAASATPRGQLAALTVREMTVDLPVEVALGRNGDGPALLTNPPRWRWATDFDEILGRMVVRYRAVPARLDEPGADS